MTSARAKLLSKRMKKDEIPPLDFTPGAHERLATHKRLLAQAVRHIDDSPPPPPPPPKPKEVIAQQEFESRPENQIVVRDDLLGCHALVTNTNRGFKKPIVDVRGVTSPRGDAVLSIEVCEPSQRRALLIADALLKAVEGRSWPVSVTKEYPRQTLIAVNGEASAFRLTEKTKRSDRPLTLEEKRKQRYEKGWRPSNPWTYAPTGEFTLHLLPEKSRYTYATFSDAKGRPLETHLNEIMVALVEQSVNRKTAQEAARLRQIEAAKAAEIRWEKEKLERHEAEELKALEAEISLWERAERIRSYARAVQARLCAEGEDLSTNLRAWLEWATKKADRIDPLCNIEDSETEESLPDED